MGSIPIGILGATGGLWLGMFASSALFSGPMLAVIVPAALAVGALGAIGGGSALQALVDKLRGK